MKQRKQAVRRKRVLVIRLSSLGDVILATSVLRTLKDHFEVFFLTKREFQQVLEGIEHAKPLILRSSKLPDVLVTSLIARRLKPDYIVDLQDKIASLLIRKLVDPSGTKTVVWNPQRAERRISVISKDFSAIKHTAVRFLEASLRVLEREGITPSYPLGSSQPQIPPDDLFPVVFPPSEPSNPILRTFSDYVLVAPEASRKTKMWNLLECNRLVLSLRRKGLDVVLVGRNPDLSAHFTEGIKLFGETSVRDLKYLVSRARCVVSLDSAISHMAWALKVPAVVIFTSTSPLMGFLSPNARIVMRENIRCRPCSVHGRNNCPAGHWICTHIPHQKVEKEVLELIENVSFAQNKPKIPKL